MELLKPISYVDGNGFEWKVPAGENVDGATIPRAAWSMVGGPYSGKYRNASVIHDRYCSTKSETWRATHDMFYDAMRCSGVSKKLAKIMYYAVYRFGPRWADPGALVDAAQADLGTGEAVEPTDAEAFSLAADIEAIVHHNLSREEVAELADSRSAEARMEAEGFAPADAIITDPNQARLLVIPGGSGDAQDQQAVADLAEKLPAFVVNRFFRKKARIVACRGSITDFETRYRGEVPRGWETTGRTWDEVPGAYLPAKKRAVIATIESDGARIVPSHEDASHGSVDLVIHECLHGYDYLTGHRDIRSAPFKEAREDDLAELSVYERQDGRGGLEETFAESGARHVSDRDTHAQAFPALAGYWDSLAANLQADLVAETALEADDFVAQEAVAETAAIGTAELGEDRTLTLFLRAVSDDGVLGHGTLTFAPGDPEYDALRARLITPNDVGPAPADTDEGPMLFIP